MFVSGDGWLTAGVVVLMGILNIITGVAIAAWQARARRR
jgi:hypothetical protein